jgi:hypothetical protein
LKGSVLGFDNSRKLVFSNWRPPSAKPVSRPENVGGEGSWPGYKNGGRVDAISETSDCGPVSHALLIALAKAAPRVNFYLRDFFTMD